VQCSAVQCSTLQCRPAPPTHGAPAWAWAWTFLLPEHRQRGRHQPMGCVAVNHALARPGLSNARQFVLNQKIPIDFCFPKIYHGSFSGSLSNSLGTSTVPALASRTLAPAPSINSYRRALKGEYPGSTTTMDPDSQHPATPQSIKPVAEDSSDTATTDAGRTSHDVAKKETPSSPDPPKPRQSILKITLVIGSILLSMFLVALDRTIISTV
jgi:hypothetical protein